VMGTARFARPSSGPMRWWGLTVTIRHSRKRWSTVPLPESTATAVSSPLAVGSGMPVSCWARAWQPRRSASVTLWALNVEPSRSAEWALVQRTVAKLSTLGMQ